RDAHRHPFPAEDELSRQVRTEIETALATLLLGARRITELDGEPLAAFRGGAGAARNVYLDPHWVGARADQPAEGRPQDFAWPLVDDMLAQSRRIALRKLVVHPDGRVELPTKLDEREGRYFALSAEAASNIGFRAESFGSIATQLGLVESKAGMSVTDVG